MNKSAISSLFLTLFSSGAVHQHLRKVYSSSLKLLHVPEPLAKFVCVVLGRKHTHGFAELFFFCSYVLLLLKITEMKTVGLNQNSEAVRH